MMYLVTGATGFIGGRLTTRLVERGHRVHALVRSRAAAAALASPGVELFEGDITKKDSLRAPMEGVDGVFHVAGWYRIGVRDRTTAEAVNIGGTRNVLETARALGIRKVVYTSSLAVFSDTKGRVVNEDYRHEGSWLSLYDETKWRAHYQVAEPMMRNGLPLVIVLPGAVYGPGDASPLHDVWVDYLKGKLRSVPRVTAFCFAHVDDIAEAHCLAMEKGKAGESYIIGGPPHTLVEALDLAARTTGVPAPKSHPPTGVVRLLAFLTRSERLKVATATYLGNNSKAVATLDYHPRSFELGFPQTILAEQDRIRATTQTTSRGPPGPP